MQCKVCGQDNPQEAGFCSKCGAVLATTVEPAVPATSTVAPEVQVEYIGFWKRFTAAIIDVVIISAVAVPIGFIPLWMGDSEFSPGPFIWVPMSWLYFWLFTWLKGQTPGKMVVGIKVVNAQGEKPRIVIAALRDILGRYISGAVIGLGFLWIAIDKEKRGWHDSIASTHVVKVEPTK